MMRLSKPKYSVEQTLDKCIAGITGNAALKLKVTSSKADITAAGTQYLSAAGTGQLHTIQPINTDSDVNPFVINNLRKSELVKIYDRYFLPAEKPAREIYDALLNAAKEQCPFCGGIGTPRNLDHFLPKAHFPQFSVLPYNLVPSCRDCNMDGKAQDFAMNAEDQIIQPYADNEKFFIHQWIFATYNADINGELGEFEYYTSPPEDWSQVDQLRVRKHFEDFDLAKRYGIKAAELLGTVLRQIETLKRACVSSEDVQSVILQPGIDEAPFVNHWQKGMFQALMLALQKQLI